MTASMKRCFVEVVPCQRFRHALAVLLSLLVLLACSHTTGASETLTLASNGTTQYVITLPANPTAPVQTAAEELQQHLKQVTGATFPIHAEAETPVDAPQIVLGPSARCKQLLPEVDVDQLGYDGIIVKTVGNKIVLTGRPSRGTLYAVYTFWKTSWGAAGGRRPRATFLGTRH